MPENSFNKGDKKMTAKTLNWFTVTLDWPYEIVMAETTVTAPREPNAFEWIIGRILHLCDERAPSFDEAADELGIMDPVFLIETAGALLEKEVIELKDSDSGLELSNCRLTELGQRFLSQKKTCDFPERHGLKLCFDMTTCKHALAAPRQMRNQPKNPIVSPDELPERMSHIGLNRARKLAKEQNEPFLTEQSKITDVQVQYELGSYQWSPVKAVFSIDAEGILHCSLPAAAKQQQQWIDQLDLGIDLVVPLFSQAPGNNADATDVPLTPFDVWYRAAGKLIHPSATIEKVENLIRDTKNELILSEYWLGIGDVRDIVIHKANQGLKCTLLRASAQSTDETWMLPEMIEVVDIDPLLNWHWLMSLVSDKQAAISLNRVAVKTPRKRNLEIIVPSFLQGFYALQLHQQFSRYRDAA
jgi:hypothetical protein